MIYAWILAGAVALAPPQAKVEMFANPSFEQGLDKWTVRGDAGCVSVVAEGALDGAQAICFDTSAPGKYARIQQTIKNAWPGKAFEIRFSYRYQAASDAAGTPLLPFSDYGKIGIDMVFYKGNEPLEADGSLGTNYYPFLVEETVRDGWITRTERFNSPAAADRFNYILTAGHFPGKLFIDNFQVTEEPFFKRKPLDMWCYNPLAVELGAPFKARVNKIFEDKSPFIDAADLYNGLLTQTALAYDEALTLLRVSSFAGKPGIGREAILRVAKLEEELNTAYRVFQAIYFENKAGDLAAKYQPLIAMIEPRIAAERKRLAQELTGLQDAAGWKRLETNAPRPYIVKPSGEPNQIMFSKLSKETHHRLERHMGLNRMWQVNSFNGAAKLGDKPLDDLDWNTPMTSLLEFAKTNEFEYLGMGTIFCAHREMPVSPLWLKNHAGDPDIYLSGNLGPAKKNGGCNDQFNFWHPAVREEVCRQAVAAGKAINPYPQPLYIAYAQEAGGPQLDTAKGRCQAGGGTNALADFHKYLAKQFETVEKLNARWKTQYKSFDEIPSLGESASKTGAPVEAVELIRAPLPAAGSEGARKTGALQPNPLGYWQKRWQMDSYIDWLASVYKAFKEGAPTKAVMTSYNRLCRRIEPARIFETGDILGFHNGAPEMAVNMILVQSMKRFAPAGKSLGQFETPWAVQNLRSRPGDERAQRAQLINFAYNLALGDLFIQPFWYAYTGQAYMMFYNGNWFDPATDALTYRYSAGGMRVAVENLGRMSDIFLGTQKVKSRILLIHPSTMAYQADGGCPWGNNENAAWSFLRERNIEFEFLPEEFLTGGREKYENYGVIILPFAPYMPDSLAKRLIEWTRAGGTLIALGPAAVYDEMGFPTGALMRELFGFVPEATANVVSTPKAWKGDKVDGDRICEKTCGKGKAIYVQHSLADSLNAGRCAERLQAVVVSAITSFAACEQNHLQLYLRERPDGTRVLFVFNSDPYLIMREKISLATDAARIVDLAVPGGFPVATRSNAGRTEFDLTLGPAQIAAFAINQAK